VYIIDLHSVSENWAQKKCRYSYACL